MPSLGAKNSSLAATTQPPRASAARSTRSWKSVIRAGERRAGDQSAGIVRFDCAIAEHFHAVDVRSLDHAIQRAPMIRCYGMPVEEVLCVDDECRVGIPDDDVRVE